MNISMTEIKNKNQAIGHHFFEKKTMKVFNSKLYDQTRTLPNGSTLFVTSEQFPGEARFWQLRRCSPSGDCLSARMGKDYPQIHFASLKEALTAMANYPEDCFED